MLRSLSALNRGRIETNAATRVRAITDAGAGLPKELCPGRSDWAQEVPEPPAQAT
jgi:hypothetical protein